MTESDAATVSMHMVFVDDSVQARPTFSGIGPLVSLGAVVVPPESLGRFGLRVEDVRRELQVPTEVELKWSPSPKDVWLRDVANTDKRRDLYGAVLEVARQCDIKSVVVVWDRGAVDHPEEKVKRDLLTWVYERVSLHLASKDLPDSGVVSHGVVVADVPGGDRRAEKKWLADTLELTNFGTQYVSRERIQMPIMTGWSHHVQHLQLADIVTSMTTAAVAGSEYAAKYIPSLLRIAYRGKPDYLPGCGVKLFPHDSLGNLYHHVFGQTHAWDSGRIRLPCGRWLFPDAESLRRPA
jgi:hypothetical protein